MVSFWGETCSVGYLEETGSTLENISARRDGLPGREGLIQGHGPEQPVLTGPDLAEGCLPTSQLLTMTLISLYIKVASIKNEQLFKNMSKIFSSCRWVENN